MKRNQAISLIGAMLLVLNAIGCTNATTREGNPPEKQVVLKMINYTGLSLEALRSANQEFRKKHPNVGMIEIADTVGRSLSSTSAQFTAFDDIDVALVNNETLPGLVQMGVIKEIPFPKMPALDPLLRGVYEDLGTQGGVRYGVPISVVPMMISINEEEIKKVTSKALSADWTWADFEQATATGKSAGLPMDLDGRLLLDPIIRAYGGYLYDYDRGSWGLDKPEAEQALSLMARLVQRGVFPSASEVRVPGTQALTLFTIRSVGRPGTVLLPLPRGAKGRPTPVSAAVAVVPAASPHTDLALQYVRELISEAGVQSALAKAGTRPVVEDAKAVASWTGSVGNRTAEAWGTALQDPFIPVRSATSAEVFSGLDAYFHGQSTYRSAVEQLLPRLKPPIQ